MTNDEKAAIWSIIIGYKNYAVSSNGVVRNLNTGKTLKPQSSKRAGEYLFVNLYYKGKRKNINIHVLVAEHFIGPRPIGTEIHHKDKNRKNPKLSNLEYLTISEHGIKRRTPLLALAEAALEMLETVKK